MKTKHLFIAALLAGLFAPALAEEAPAGSDPRKLIRIETPNLAMFDEGLRIHGRNIKNAPYSAQTVMESNQMLPDGNQITSRVVTMTYRDAAGRTRQEVHDRNGSDTVIIRDDTSTWILKPAEKTATKVPNDGSEMRRLAAEKARVAVDAARRSAEAARKSAETARAQARADAEKAREEARAKSEQLRREGKLGPDEEIVVKRLHRGDFMGPEQARKLSEEIRVRVAKDIDLHSAEIAQRIGPAIANAFGDSRFMRNRTTKDLGTRDFDGVKAEGRLRSYEIPAGEVGNKNAIVVSDETWYAPDLKITVYSKHSDPRSGDRVFKLENLKREEPAAALFTVPSDYAVKDVLAELKAK